MFFWEHITEPSSDFPGWNNANFSMEDISMYNLTGVIKASSDPSNNDTQSDDFISTAQGFDIKATAKIIAAFTNSVRRLTGNTTLRSSLEVTKERDRLWLSISNVTYRLSGSM